MKTNLPVNRSRELIPLQASDAQPAPIVTNATHCHSNAYSRLCGYMQITENTFMQLFTTKNADKAALSTKSRLEPDPLPPCCFPALSSDSRMLPFPLQVPDLTLFNRFYPAQSRTKSALPELALNRPPRFVFFPEQVRHDP